MHFRMAPYIRTNISGILLNKGHVKKDECPRDPCVWDNVHDNVSAGKGACNYVKVNIFGLHISIRDQSLNVYASV